MNTVVLRRVRRMFNSPYVPTEHNRTYQRRWVQQIRMLGSRWILAKKIERTSTY